MTKESQRHPIQPIIEDDHGVLRFKENRVVQYLLDNGGIDMNTLACIDFPAEDREQFAQLIGYSLSGFSELSYVSNEVYSAATNMAELGETEEAARIVHLSSEIQAIREMLRGPVARLYGIHPDDLVQN